MIQVVGMGAFLVSADRADTLVTYALGSCIGISAHDPKARIGGLLHFMLPDSSINPEKAVAQPGMFADTGLKAFLDDLRGQGALFQRLVLKMAGASSSRGQDDFFDIGRRNLLAAKRLLWRHGLSVSGEECGGDLIRTLRLEIETGRVLLKDSVRGGDF